MRRILSSLPDSRNTIPKGKDQEWQDMYNVGFKETSQTFTETFKSKQRSFPCLLILFILNVGPENIDHIIIFQSGHSKAFDHSCKTKCSTFSFSKVLSFLQVSKLLGNHILHLLFLPSQNLDQRWQTL